LMRARGARDGRGCASKQQHAEGGERQANPHAGAEMRDTSQRVQRTCQPRARLGGERGEIYRGAGI
jgi:hypothetical protein